MPPDDHYHRPRSVAPAALVRTDPPPEQSLPLWFHPDQYLRLLGGASWREVTHPRQMSTTEYEHQRLHRVKLDLYFDAQRGSGGADIESDLSLIESWQRPVNQADPLSEPPRIQVRYGQGQQLRWVITDILPRVEHRERPDGPRVAAHWTVDLLQHNTGDLAFATPLEEAASTGAVVSANGHYIRHGGGGTRTYTVRAGDTLSGIAARELGAASRWPEIAELNDLADPDLITVGQVLTLPES